MITVGFFLNYVKKAREKEDEEEAELQRCWHGTKSIEKQVGRRLWVATWEEGERRRIRKEGVGLASGLRKREEKEAQSERVERRKFREKLGRGER